MPVSRGLEKSNVTAQINLTMRVTLRHKRNMTTENIESLIASVNARRNEAYDVAKHDALVADVNRLVAAGYEADFVTNEWKKVA